MHAPVKTAISLALCGALQFVAAYAVAADTAADTAAPPAAQAAATVLPGDDFFGYLLINRNSKFIHIIQ